MPPSRCPSSSREAAIIATVLIVAWVGVVKLRDTFSPSTSTSTSGLSAPPVVSSRHTPNGLSDAGMSTFGDFFVQAANPVCPRSMEPVSTYADFLEMLRTNNTQCFPTEAPLSPTTKFLTGLGLMFALLANILETAFDMTSTFSPLLNDASKAVIVFSLISSLSCVGIFWSGMPQWIPQAWYVARVTVPALVQSLVSQLLDRVVPQHLFGSNTSSRPEHDRRQSMLFKLTLMALARILTECLLRSGETLIELPPTPQMEHSFLIFKLSAICFVPIAAIFKLGSERLYISAVAFLCLHDAIHWLHACAFESLRLPWPFNPTVIDILRVPGLRNAIVVLAFLDYCANGDAARPPAHHASGRW